MTRRIQHVGLLRGVGLLRRGGIPRGGPVRHRAAGPRRPRTAAAAVTAAALAAALAGCGGSLEQQGTSGSATARGSGDRGPLVIGSAGFTESTVLAQLYAKVLAAAGYRTSIRTLENRELYEPALEKGQIDIVPEYAATLAEFLNTKANGPNAAPVASADVRATVAALTRLAAPRGLKVLPAGPAVDQNAFAVSRSFAARYHLRTLSDLGRAKVKVRIAAGDECTVRPFCEPGLVKTYGIDITGVDPKGVGTPQAKQAVEDGTDQLVLTTSTDATLDQFGLVLLEDDRRLQDADNVLPVVNAARAGGPAVAAALDRLTRTLTTADLTALDRQVDAERRLPAAAAESYLRPKGLLGKQ